MKELLEIFIYKPKKTEKIIIAVLKLVFTLSFTIWIYETIGIKDIYSNLTEFDKLKITILNGHILLFGFTYYIVYAVFFKFSSYAFSIIGFFSYWIFRLIWFVTSNILDLIFSFLRLIFTFKWKFSFKSETKLDDSFFAFSNRLLKIAFVKIGLMKSYDQRVRDSKEMGLLIKVSRKALIEDKEVIYNKIHIVFVFTALFYIFYFYHLKYTATIIPEVDFIVRWICVLSAFLQLILYWIYSHFRDIYYLYLVFYRGMHNQDVLKQKLEEYAMIQFQEIQRTIEASLEGHNFEEIENRE